MTFQRYKSFYFQNIIKIKAFIKDETTTASFTSIQDGGRRKYEMCF